MTNMNVASYRVGADIHGVRVNVAADYDGLFNYLAMLLGSDACAPWESPHLDVSVTWRTEPLPEGASAFDGNGADGVGKRMLRRHDELVWFDTYRDKGLQLRFRARDGCYAFDVDYGYHPSARKLERYPDYERRKFFSLFRYVVHFPVAWYLQRTRGWTLLHASAVADGDRAVLVAGPGGAGKTTTCLGLMAAGMDLVSENLLFSDGEHVFPLAEPIRLTDDSLALLDEIPVELEAVAQGGGLKHKTMFRWPQAASAEPVRPAAVFLPCFVDAGYVRPLAADLACEVIHAANRLTLELNDYDWYTAALDLMWPAPGGVGRQYRVLQRLTASTPCYTLGIDRRAGVEPVVSRIVAVLEGSALGAARPAVARRAPIEIGTGDGSCPIRCFSTHDLLPDEAARAQLEAVAALPGVIHHVSVLPDVHFKSRNPSPTGSVLVTRDVIVPRAIDPGINCGIRIVATSVPIRELTPRLLDELYGRLRAALPLDAHAQPMLTAEQCHEMLSCGLTPVAAALDIPERELDRIENRGRMMPELSSTAIGEVVTAKAIRKGNPWLGTLGAGNHFLELQEIVEVLSSDEARALGLERGCAVFMMHTDSRRLGKQIMKPLRNEAEQALGLQEPGHRAGPDGLWTLPADGDLGRRFLCGLAAASHAALANRAAITAILRRTIHALLGSEIADSVSLVYDCGHETIQRELHGGEWLWVHRHGASSARPPGTLVHDPVLATIGQPVPIPGSMGSVSFIAVAQPGVADTFHSVAHGAGRVLEKARAAAAFDPAHVEASVREFGVRLYRYGADNIAGQAPASFKDVQGVVQAMETHNLIRPVARLRPIAVLKG
jgi:tRNA-splicing ligase RtcB (3'-phosphate/5'-hydroxy nucleic acid ligase)